MKRNVLVTGGCGKIGSYFIRASKDEYSFRVVDRAAWDTERFGELPGESLVLDLSDLEACQSACEGMEVVIHLAADPSPQARFYESLLPDNILATYNIFQAARDAGCRRVIYASSLHAVAAYPPDVQIKTDMPVRPTSLYGVSKCFGEALAAHYAVNEGVPSIAVRIGAYLFPGELEQLPLNHVNAYLHPDDFNQLLVRCIETPDIQFLIAHAISNNRHKRVDLSETRSILGYQPVYDGFEMLKL